TKHCCAAGITWIIMTTMISETEWGTRNEIPIRGESERKCPVKRGSFSTSRRWRRNQRQHTTGEKLSGDPRAQKMQVRPYQTTRWVAHYLISPMRQVRYRGLPS